ncbi:glycosyltransferase [Azospirillum picis]|uniref:Glycogen(Starch) synthase n=1 Tax=Azospirillum picis TaxID=488438 RepID=A0ABU0MHP8_9PROT|nr:glycosyltransferase [Azospirillum picis]MBP2299377.1 glycogen(starch) synthase [Azospirillum picis]MDQ0532985.1 glycogen(starch) synthase [Azospirillum picis]
MRLSLLTPEYPPGDWLGGIATHTGTMARALSRLGHTVQVVTPWRGGPAPAGTSLEDGVTVERVDPGARIHPVADRFRTNRRLAAAVRAFAPDVVHAAEFDADAWWLTRFGGPPVVTRLATPTGLVMDTNSQPWVPHTHLLNAMERDQTRRSAAIYASTRAIARRVADYWKIAPELIQVVPNSIDLAALRAAGAGRPPMPLPERYMVFFGRLEGRKGIGPLGRALPDVLAANPDLHLVMVGGEDPASLPAIAQFRRDVAPVADRVHFLGALPRGEALSVVARAELAVVPSLWESFGFVVVEAMALGVPVVASDCGGIPEIVEDGRSGWLVPPGEAQPLRDALIARLADREGLRAAAEAGRARATAFDVQAVAVQVAALLEHAKAERGNAATSTIYNNGYRRHFRPDHPTTPFYRIYDEKRRAVAAELERSPRLRILDVGGGYGRITGPFAERHDVTLVDISHEMLNEAKERFPALTVQQADARKLPFPDASFDLVIAMDLLCHLPDLEAGVRELRRVVKPGGRIACDTTNANPLWVVAYPSYYRWRPDRLLATMRCHGVLPEWKALVRHHWAPEMRKAIAATGLTLQKTDHFGPPGVAKWHLWWCRRGGNGPEGQAS